MTDVPADAASRGRAGPRSRLASAGPQRDPRPDGASTSRPQVRPGPSSDVTLPRLAVRPLSLSAGPEVVALLRLQRAAYAVEAALIGSDALPGLHEDATALAASGETILGAWLAAPAARGTAPETAAGNASPQDARRPSGPPSAGAAPAATRTSPTAGAASTPAGTRTFPAGGTRLAGALGFTWAGDTVTIHRLVVRPALFRRGIATALLDALDRARPGADRTLVATGSANAPALALYAGRGFTRAGERRTGPGVWVTDLARPRAAGRAGPPGAA